MINEIITIYAIINDLLKAIGHDEDNRCVMSDAEIITTALVAAMFFMVIIVWLVSTFKSIILFQKC
jgi:hypothetical protein